MVPCLLVLHPKELKDFLCFSCFNHAIISTHGSHHRDGLFTVKKYIIVIKLKVIPSVRNRMVSISFFQERKNAFVKINLPSDNNLFVAQLQDSIGG